MDVFAVGGRYDAMIAGYCNIKEQNVDTRQSAVGVSISLDKILQGIDSSDNISNGLDAVICSLGSKALIKEKTSVSNKFNKIICNQQIPYLFVKYNPEI